MRKIICKFNCDNCNKEVTRIKNGSDRDFPWDEGWVEINELDIGAPINASHRLIDQPQKIEMSNRDFCGKQCLLAFIDKHLQEASIVRMPQKPLTRSDEDEPGEQIYPPPPPPPKPMREEHYHKDFSRELREPSYRYQEPPQEERIEEVNEPKKKRGFFG